MQIRYMDENSNICPYCKKSLNYIPVKDVACPFCGNMIYVRQSKDKKEQLEYYDRLLSESKESSIFIKKIFESIKGWTLNEDDFNNRKNFMILKTGKVPKDTEVLRSLILELQAKGIIVYNQLALILNWEGKDTYQFLFNARKSELTNLKKSKIVQKVKIISGAKHGEIESCPECKSIQGKIFTIDEALKQMPLPNKNCTCKIYDKTRGLCRCVYTAAF
ncbi:MAG: hypothetical protein N3E50_07450 [Candidatus Goldbacteria bacterium]|nr:hypothetical protein [Candidatus Goldiibacteriota bacterium]